MRICYIWDFIILQIICTSFIISNVTIKYYDPTMILLMGMWISLTKNPMNPIIANPMAVATAIFWNSKKEYQWIYDIQPQYNQTVKSTWTQSKDYKIGRTFSIWFCASLDKSYAILWELPQGLQCLHDLIHVVDISNLLEP